MRRAWLAAAIFAAVMGAAFSTASEVVAAPARPPAGDIYAIVIGYNGGDAGLPTLRFADDDAVRFALFFAGLDAPERPSRVWLLSELDAETTDGLRNAGLATPAPRAPTRTALFAAFAEIERALAARARTDRPATLYVLYAGHGLKGRILMKPEDAPVAAVTGHEIRAAVAELARGVPALRTYLFFDACRSQSLFTERGGDGDPELGPDLAAAASELVARANAVSIGVLTAAAAGKPAGEVPDLGAGYFSHVLASGLAGAADADGDDVVSFGELAAFVAFNTERLTGQRPWFSPPSGDLGAPVIDLLGRGTRLDLSSSAPGRYLIAAAPGRPIFAEAWKGDRLPLRLVLPAGRYRVVRAAIGERARRTEILLRAEAPMDLSRATWSDDDAVSIAARGASSSADGLAFAAAFTPDVVSTLTAGYDAGRAPPVPGPTASRSRHALAVGLALGSAPLGLAGAEAQAALRYRRHFGPHSFFEGALRLGRSSHATSGAYALDRVTALVGGGARVGVGRRVELSVSVMGGGGPVLRRGDGALTGDAFAPTAAAGVAAAIEIGEGWSVYAGVCTTVQWIRVDDRRQASVDPLGELGGALAF